MDAVPWDQPLLSTEDVRALLLDIQAVQGGQNYPPQFSFIILANADPAFYGMPGTACRRNFAFKFHHLSRMAPDRYQALLERLFPL